MRHHGNVSDRVIDDITAHTFLQIFVGMSKTQQPHAHGDRRIFAAAARAKSKRAPPLNVLYRRRS